jgi:FAD/FMN-containing dehydrogenase
MFNPGALAAPFEVLPSVPRDQRPAFTVDATSRLAELDARLSLGAVEALLSRHGLTLALTGEVDWSRCVAAWLAAGFPGAQDAWADPVSSRVAGFEASAGGVQACVRSAPRRATGPDLLALFAGAQGAIGEVERVTLVVSERGAAESRRAPFHWDRDPPLAPAEARAFALAKRRLGAQ